MLEDLNESLGDLDEGLPKPSDLLATLPPLKMREENLPLFNGEETQEAVSEAITHGVEECKKAIGWKFFYLKGINPLVCTHHIYMEEKLSQFIDPKEVMPKKSGITVVQNDKGEEVSTHLTSVLKRVSGHPFYCFLDGYSGRNAISWYPKGIFLRHIISKKGIEVDKAKVELIAKLPSPTTVAKSALGCENDVLLAAKFRSPLARTAAVFSLEASRYLRPTF
ncbi:hypothetical protein CK203_115000 [Vitis vinifera]|uniref:Reverse transcriptase/retrotransposon-derived protein RNase H-like domain-containing protein n=1 Tax=Vitis vinifera TaxID=29760 RepID=A0A438CE42_VITVI|nr:hypothetical protein CK203_115000 [Vitis vinifera]